MKQAQPSTATLEAASMPAAGRKTATGVFDTWRGSNLWEQQTFTPKLQWGVRYSQTDPAQEEYYFYLNPYDYSGQNPLRFVDPLGERYWPPPIGGHITNYSLCSVTVFGDAGPRGPEGVGEVPPGTFVPGIPGSMPGFVVPGQSGILGDVDFICVNHQWYKVRGPVWITINGRVGGWHRPASPDETAGLPPCDAEPCPC